MADLSRGVIAIDDSGTPGAQSRSTALPPSRKTWAAAIIHPDMVSNASQAMSIFLDGIRPDFAADELHFTDIYGGRGAFKGVADKRLFELMTAIFTNRIA